MTPTPVTANTSAVTTQGIENQITSLDRQVQSLNQAANGARTAIADLEREITAIVAAIRAIAPHSGV